MPRDLRAALKDLGWSQADLARRCEINKSTPSEWMGKPTEPIPGPIAAYVALSLEVKKLSELVAPKRDK